MRLLENEELKLTLDTKKSLIEKQKENLSKQEQKLEAFLLSNKDLNDKLKSLDSQKKELLSNINKLDNELKNKNEKLVLFEEKSNKDSLEKKSLELNLQKLEDLSKQKEEKLNKVLEDLLLKEKLISSFKQKNEDLNKIIQENEQALEFTKEENKSLSTQSKEYKERIESLTKASEQKETRLNKLIEELLIKKNLISSFEEKNQLLDDEMKVMKHKLNESLKEHETISKELASTKQKIKSFTGIRVKVISQLKNKLGDSIQIDPKNGSLRLSSKILFDQGEFDLKDSSKEALKVAVYDYFQTILDNEEINRHIDKIVIEGHTNSKGNYLYNLELSQKRAYSVMDFLLTLDFNKQENLKELIAASGRAFLDPIYNKSGVEDEDASRRIEIKLSLKNEQAIKEIANLLE